MNVRSTYVPFDQCSIRPMFHSTNVPFDECSVRWMFHSTNVPFDHCSFDESVFDESTPTRIVREGIVHGGKCPGGKAPGGTARGGSVLEPSIYHVLYLWHYLISFKETKIKLKYFIIIHSSNQYAWVIFFNRLELIQSIMQIEMVFPYNSYCFLSIYL